MTFLTSLAQSAHLILDGATGTELNRRGVETGLPLWSAQALINERDARILQNIHEDCCGTTPDHIRQLAKSLNEAMGQDMVEPEKK